MTQFSSFAIDERLLRALSNMGFEEATPIQEKVIPLLLSGRDIIGQAQTGTGKTAAFGIPLLNRIDLDDTSIQAMVLTPTRELAIQVAEELTKIGKYKRVDVVAVYGGQEIDRQIRALKKKPQVIVGTPGRLQDHIRRRTIRLQDLKVVVLDEADEMLDMGFVEDIQAILENVPDERQTLLFSATMPPKIKELAQQFLHEPEHISVIPKELTVPNIDQTYLEVPERQKFDVLCRLIDIDNPELSIVFGRTKRRVDELSEGLAVRGYQAAGIHGDLTQRQRDEVMRKFKDGQLDILVATDVAARGLDISGVTHVYNFDIPQDPESYVHRIGRTGRAGKKGSAITFVVPREMDYLKMIERIAKITLKRRALPSIAQAIQGKQRIAVDQLMEVIAKGELGMYREVAEELLDQIDSVTLLSAALKVITNEKEDLKPVILTEEAPLRATKRLRTSDPRSSQRRNARDGEGYRRSFKGEGSFRRGPKPDGGNRRPRGGASRQKGE